MSSASTAYPFVPRSNKALQPGQFWDIPLSNGQHAAGVVVAVPSPSQAPHLAINTRMFVAGLLDWSGSERPTPSAVIGAGLVTWGSAHVRTVTEAGGNGLLGRIEAPLPVVRMLSHGGGGTVWVYSNGLRGAPASPDELLSLGITGGWGLAFANGLAERLFVDGLPLVLGQPSLGWPRDQNIEYRS